MATSSWNIAKHLCRALPTNSRLNLRLRLFQTESKPTTHWLLEGQSCNSLAMAILTHGHLHLLILFLAEGSSEESQNWWYKKINQVRACCNCNSACVVVCRKVTSKAPIYSHPSKPEWPGTTSQRQILNKLICLISLAPSLLKNGILIELRSFDWTSNFFRQIAAHAMPPCPQLPCISRSGSSGKSMPPQNNKTTITTPLRIKKPNPFTCCVTWAPLNSEPFSWIAKQVCKASTNWTPIRTQVLRQWRFWCYHELIRNQETSPDSSKTTTFPWRFCNTSIPDMVP